MIHLGCEFCVVMKEVLGCELVFGLPLAARAAGAVGCDGVACN